MICTFAVAFAALSLSVPAMAQQTLTLERIFGNPPLAGPTPRLLKLSPDGRWLTSLRNRPDEKERFDLWALDTATGAERMLVDSKGSRNPDESPIETTFFSHAFERRPGANRTGRGSACAAPSRLDSKVAAASSSLIRFDE